MRRRSNCYVGQTENYRNYEVRFVVSIANFSSNANSKLPELLAVFMLLANSSIDSNQRILILASAAKCSLSSDMLTNQEVLDSVKYEAIAAFFSIVINQSPKSTL